MARFTRHQAGFDHTRWLSLIDVSGPFLSLPVLRRTWPSLDALDRNIRERLRLAHAAFPERPWIDYVLTELLEWGELVCFGTDVADLSMKMATYDTALTPSFALLEPGAEFDGEAKNVRLLGLVCDGHPHRRINDSDWPAPPVDRLAQLCRHHDVEFGLATDGRWWAFVWAPRGGVTTTATFDSANWHESAERDVVRAFLSILGRYRFFGVPDDETLHALLKESLGNQEDITEALGVQVRQAVELLVAAIGRAHTAEVARGGPGIGDVEASDVYRGAVAVMIRIIFVLFAEERGYLPADKPLYRASYSAGLLCTELEQRARDGSEEDLEHMYDGWHRLVALFNAICNGVEHPDVPVRGYDGSIFDEDRYAWLPLTIDDRTVLHMLQAVQYVHIGIGKSRERRRLSFRTVTVEEIGYVYEGLLSFDAFYADETFVCLTGKPGLEDEVPLRVIEGLAATCPDIPSLGEKLAVEYKKSGIGSARALAKRLQPLPEAERQEARRKLLAVTRGDYSLAERLLPFFGIIRRDLRGLPVVILTDGLYVTESRLRKNTGAHYTPRFLAEEVVEGALEPLVYFPGPLQTANEKEWRHKSSADILSLKVADIAVGSGAFLVAACRYLANHLVTAWIDEGDERARDRDIAITVEMLDADADPVVIDARRQIIEHCLYGADINDMAVDMAKLSLWLVSMDPSKPFTFLDDRLIVGDSLLGITSLDQLRVLHMDAERGRELHEDQNALFSLTADIRELVDRITRRRRQVVEIDGTNLGGLEAKRTLLAENRRDSAHAWLLADLATGAALTCAGRGAVSLDKASKQAVAAALKAMLAGKPAVRGQLAAWLSTDLPNGAFRRRPLHWPLAFPEVFQSGGFDAIIGNPPFLGGPKIRPSLGFRYRELLGTVVAGHVRATNADLVAYFVLRSHDLVNHGGQCGIIATNTLAQGDTREVGLDQVVARGVTIRRAVKSKRWPTKRVSLEYCFICSSAADLGAAAEVSIEDRRVRNISSSLEDAFRVFGPTRRLASNSGLAYVGHHVNGMGFLLDETEVVEVALNDHRSLEVIYPYLNGRDVGSQPDSSAGRKIIQFHAMSKDEASVYVSAMERVRTLVKPERSKRNRESHRKYWWRYADYRRGLESALEGLERVIVITLVSKTVMPVMVPTGQVFSHALGVFTTDDTAMLALLSSAPHYWWAVSRASSMKADLRYTPSDVFETLPLPEMTEEMRALGDRLDRFRREVMLARQAGLTKTYNMVHDPKCTDADIAELRAIHRAIDEAVCRAYRWEDLTPDLQHGHHKAGREIRYTVGQFARREFVDRLLELNQERYVAEVAAGLHERKTRKAKRKHSSALAVYRVDRLTMVT